MFGSLIWYIWCWRNDRIFGNLDRHVESVLQRSLRMQHSFVVASLQVSADSRARGCLTNTAQSVVRRLKPPRAGASSILMELSLVILDWRRAAAW
ncbi:hypothetical protein V6N11_057860 [Hibiscus sabdariffa]|uniref:Uncharacterized protein n=1 Tax=Hibiscus sabdariffa TaxID=183260 RepID=A0ABR2P466_9ROSI